MEEIEEPKINIKWSYGEPGQKSCVKKSNPFSDAHISASEFGIGENNQKQLSRDFVPPENVPQVLYGNVAKESFQSKQNKREENNNKMLEREMIAQTNKNPFLLGNDYLEDLTVQDEFLKPQNSNFDSDYKRK